MAYQGMNPFSTFFTKKKEQIKQEQTEIEGKKIITDCL